MAHEIEASKLNLQVMNELNLFFTVFDDVSLAF